MQADGQNALMILDVCSKLAELPPPPNNQSVRFNISAAVPQWGPASGVYPALYMSDLRTLSARRLPVQ